MDAFLEEGKWNSRNLGFCLTLWEQNKHPNSLCKFKSTVAAGNQIGRLAQNQEAMQTSAEYDSFCPQRNLGITLPLVEPQV